MALLAHFEVTDIYEFEDNIYGYSYIQLPEKIFVHIKGKSELLENNLDSEALLIALFSLDYMSYYIQHS